MTLSGHHGPVPVVVVRCIEYLDVIGLKEVGLYRYLTKLIAESLGLCVTWGFCAQCLMQVVFRSYFRRWLRFPPPPNQSPRRCHSPQGLPAQTYFLPLTVVPEPLISTTLIAQMQPSLPSNITPNFDTPSHHTLLKLHKVACTLPDENFFLLRILCAHLNRIARFSQVNKMSVSNLGLIFCPTLEIGSSLFAWLVVGWETVFSTTYSSGSRRGRMLSPRSLDDMFCRLSDSRRPLSMPPPPLPPRPKSPFYESSKPPLRKKPPKPIIETKEESLVGISKTQVEKALQPGSPSLMAVDIVDGSGHISFGVLNVNPRAGRF